MSGLRPACHLELRLFPRETFRLFLFIPLLLTFYPMLCYCLFVPHPPHPPLRAALSYVWKQQPALFSPSLQVPWHWIRVVVHLGRSDPCACVRGACCSEVCFTGGTPVSWTPIWFVAHFVFQIKQNPPFCTIVIQDCTPDGKSITPRVVFYVAFEQSFNADFHVF